MKMFQEGFEYRKGSLTDYFMAFIIIPMCNLAFYLGLVDKGWAVKEEEISITVDYTEFSWTGSDGKVLFSFTYDDDSWFGKIMEWIRKRYGK